MQALIRAELPGNTAKKLARLVSVPLATARHWIHVHLPAYRAPEIALMLIDEHLQENERRKERFLKLCEMAGITHEVEMLGTDDPSVDDIAHRLFAKADRMGAAAGRTEAFAKWLAKKASE